MNVMFYVFAFLFGGVVGAFVSRRMTVDALKTALNEILDFTENDEEEDEEDNEEETFDDGFTEEEEY